MDVAHELAMIWKLALKAALGMKHIIIMPDAWFHDCRCGLICHFRIPMGRLLHSGDTMSRIF